MQVHTGWGFLFFSHCLPAQSSLFPGSWLLNRHRTDLSYCHHVSWRQYLQMLLCSACLCAGGAVVRGPHRWAWGPCQEHFSAALRAEFADRGWGRDDMGTNVMCVKTFITRPPEKWITRRSIFSIFGSWEWGLVSHAGPTSPSHCTASTCCCRDCNTE